MEQEKCWLRFIISGKVEDYLRFNDARKKHEINFGGSNAFYNTRSCYSGKEYRGERSLSNPPDT
ncbi:MAG: hypothetical protein E7562_03500 [Ruminococcaceae bacterium]|nr:hypothetical protein [Oscillospiraceae bacterium]